jgi:hypothetical protein
MKKILTLLMILLVAQNINSQQSRFVVEHCAGKDVFQSSDGLISSNELRTRWFMMIPTYLNNTINPIPNGFSVIKLNIGKTSTNDKIIIRFCDSKTVILKAYAVVNNYCETTKFYASVSDIYLLKNYPINSIKYVSGTDGSSFTHQPKNSEESFFINAFNNFEVKNVNCIDIK